MTGGGVGAARQALLRAMPEAEFQAQVIELAQLCGWRVYHTHDSRGSAAGFPDLAMVRRGRLVFAELKREGGEPTREQQAWLRDLEGVALTHCGHTTVAVHVWRPSDWSKIEETLR